MGSAAHAGRAASSVRGCKGGGTGQGARCDASRHAAQRAGRGRLSDFAPVSERPSHGIPARPVPVGRRAELR